MYYGDTDNANYENRKIPTGVQLLDLVIKDIKNDFNYSKGQLCDSDTDNLRKTIKTYIDALDELYWRLKFIV